MIGQFKKRWMERQEAIWQAQYHETEQDWKKKLDDLDSGLKLKAELLQRDQASLDDITKRVQDKREELERANQELKEQIRLIEAKASPDSVWVEAFSQGFSKAFDMASVIHQKGLDKLLEQARDSAIDQAIASLDAVVAKRIQEAGSINLQLPHVLLTKRRVFEQKLSQSKSEDRKAQCKYYIEVIDWVIGAQNGDQVHTD